MNEERLPAGDRGNGQRERADGIDPLDIHRFTGIAELPAQDALNPGPLSSSVRMPDRQHPETSGEALPQPGTTVRIKPSDRLVSPWSEYAESGHAMRIRAVDPRRGRRCVSLQPLDAPARSLRHEWFAKADLEEWAETVQPDLRDLLHTRTAEMRVPDDAADVVEEQSGVTLPDGLPAEAAGVPEEAGGVPEEEAPAVPEEVAAVPEEAADEAGGARGVSLYARPIQLETGPDLFYHSAYTVMIDFYKTAGGDSGYVVTFDGSFSLFVGQESIGATVCYDRGERRMRSGKIRLDARRWYRLALVFSGETGQADLYLDGERLCGIGDLEGARQAGNYFAPLCIGCPEGGSFPGRIDRFKFLDRAIPAGELAEA